MLIKKSEANTLRKKNKIETKIQYDIYRMTIILHLSYDINRKRCLTPMQHTTTCTIGYAIWNNVGLYIDTHS